MFRYLNMTIWKMMVFVMIMQLTLFLNNAMAGTLTKLKTIGPEPSERSLPAVASLGPYIYVFGGVKDDSYTKKNTFYNDLYRLNTQTNTWEKLSAKISPPSRSFAAMLGDEKKGVIVMFGGAHYGKEFSNLTMFNDMWMYSPENNSWEKLKPHNQGPCARAKPKAWLVDNQMYIFSGITSTFQLLNDMWKYDLQTNTWTNLIPNNVSGSPSPRQGTLGGTSQSSQHKLTIYGGEAFSGKQDFNILDDTWEYDIKTNRWKNVTPVKKENVIPPRNSGSAVVIGDNLYMQGGDLGDVDIHLAKGQTLPCGATFVQITTDELWDFDQINHLWKKQEVSGDLLPRLKHTSATATNGKMYIFGGFDFHCYDPKKPGQIWNKYVYSYDPK